MAKLIDYKNVDIYRKELLVLKNVNFSLEEGEFTYLIGRVGSGKSSLMKTMYAEIPIDNGEATIFDYDLNKIKRRDVPMLRRQIGIVFQDFQLLSDRSVYDNLLFVLKATGWKNKAEIDERINEVLKEVGMSNKSYKMPHELSGGEQQRIAIARALLNKPKLILADEPTGALDSHTGREVLGMLQQMHDEGHTVVLITHDNSIAVQADRIIRLEDGRVVYDGDAHAPEAVVQPTLLPDEEEKA